MSKEKQMALERVTMTLPKGLLEQIEKQMQSGLYASVSEWIRHAIREQIQRDETALEALIREQPMVAQSMAEAESGQVREYDPSRLRARIKKKP